MTTSTHLQVYFEDGGDMKMVADDVFKLSRDLGSCFAFIQMLAGGAPAKMHARLKSGDVEHFVVGRPEQMNRGDTYRNYA